MPKFFVGEPFCAVFQNLPLAKNSWKGGGALGLSVEKLSSHSAESFSGGGMFSVSQVSGIGKIHASEG